MPAATGLALVPIWIGKHCGRYDRQPRFLVCGKQREQLAPDIGKLRRTLRYQRTIGLAYLSNSTRVIRIIGLHVPQLALVGINLLAQTLHAGTRSRDDGFDGQLLFVGQTEHSTTANNAHALSFIIRTPKCRVESPLRQSKILR